MALNGQFPSVADDRFGDARLKSGAAARYGTEDTLAAHSCPQLRMGLQLYFCCYTLDLAMRTSTFPPIRVEPEMRAQTEAVLREGESLTQFIEDAVR